MAKKKKLKKSTTKPINWNKALKKALEQEGDRDAHRIEKLEIPESIHFELYEKINEIVDALNIKCE